MYEGLRKGNCKNIPAIKKEQRNFLSTSMTCRARTKKVDCFFSNAATYTRTFISWLLRVLSQPRGNKIKVVFAARVRITWEQTEMCSHQKQKHLNLQNKTIFTKHSVRMSVLTLSNKKTGSSSRKIPLTSKKHCYLRRSKNYAKNFHFFLWLFLLFLVWINFFFHAFILYPPC